MNKQQIITNLIPILEAYIADESLLQPRTITRLSLPIAWLTVDHLTTYLDQHPDWQRSVHPEPIAYYHTTHLLTRITLSGPDPIVIETAVNALAAISEAHPYQLIIDLYKSLLPDLDPDDPDPDDESGLFLSPDEMARFSSNMRGMS